MLKGLPFLSGEKIWESPREVNEAFADDVAHGFEQKPKKLRSRWFYDDEGSRLFSRIMDLEDYYLTRRETQILETHSHGIAELMSREPWCIVEMGAGDGRKTRILLDALLKQKADIEYWPVDVSTGALSTLCSRMKRDLPKLKCHSLVADNIDGLREIAENRRGRRLLVLFLGSSVGNSTREEMESQLRKVRRELSPGDAALIGFDLMKDPAVLQKAYADREGVTREFNLNLLTRMNRELGANFDVTQFRHQATWNPWIRGMESWLVSLRDQTVYFSALNREFHFKNWEAIHTEISLKFEPTELERLASNNGYQMIARYSDQGAEFSDALWLAGHQN